MATGRINDLWHRKDRTRTNRYGTGKRWQAVWTDGAGKETKKSFDYKDAAQKWIDAKTIDSTLSPYGLRPDLPFEDYWKIWRAKQAHQRPNSLRTIDSHCTKWVVPSFEGWMLTKITRDEVQAAVNDWHSHGNAASTVALMYRYTSQIFKEAVMDRRIRESPCVRIRLPEIEEKVFTFIPATLAKLVDLLDEPFKSAALVCAATGLRPGELIGLSKQDIDFQGNVIKMRFQDNSKSYDALSRAPLKTKYSKRNISFGPVLRALLLRLCNNAGQEGRLFHESGRPIIFSTRSAWETAREELPEIGPGWHQLRHYHASALIAAGFSPVAVANRLGHKDATVTLQVYSHMWDSDDARMSVVADEIVEPGGDSSATEPPQVA